MSDPWFEAGPPVPSLPGIAGRTEKLKIAHELLPPSAAECATVGSTSEVMKPTSMKDDYDGLIRTTVYRLS